MRKAWSFVDPVTSEEYFFEVNPHTDSNSNQRSRSAAYTVVAGSRQDSLTEHTIDTIFFEAHIEQSTFSYQGNVYTEQQFDDLTSWANKPYEVEMYDDLDRGKLVYITSFAPSRVRSRSYLYKHAYTLSGIILQEI